MVCILIMIVNGLNKYYDEIFFREKDFLTLNANI